MGKLFLGLVALGVAAAATATAFYLVNRKVEEQENDYESDLDMLLVDATDDILSDISTPGENMSVMGDVLPDVDNNQNTL